MRHGVIAIGRDVKWVGLARNLTIQTWNQPVTVLTRLGIVTSRFRNIDMLNYNKLRP